MLEINLFQTTDMKRIILLFIIVLFPVTFVNAQSNDSFVSECVMNLGGGVKYLKDFKVQLGKKTDMDQDLRYKDHMSLWKNTHYRFTLCNDNNSKGLLVLTIKDENNREVASSFDPSTGKVYPSIDFKCGRSGVYQLCFDFYGGEAGTGVGVVSMVNSN